MNQESFMLALHRRLNLTRPRYEKLQAFFADDWQAAYQANIKAWQAAGLEPKAIEKFFGTPEKYAPAQELDQLKAVGAWLLTPRSSHYPPLWQNINQSPAVVLGRGRPENLATKALAVVGSRKMTDYGQRVLQRILKPVFEKQITVVSGLALGVDAAAHQLALGCRAPTVAVLGNGIDQIYPKSHAALGQKIIEADGTIVSEYLPGTEPIPEYFPQRNRLVAGLGRATVVVEGAAKSGSLITGRLANEQGREVWAAPGDVFRASSAGPNLLISQGEAAPLLNAEQLLESLGLTAAPVLKNIELPANEAAVLQRLAAQPQWELDLFLATCPEPAAELNTTLTMLELKGVVQKHGSIIFAV